VITLKFLRAKATTAFSAS